MHVVTLIKRQCGAFVKRQRGRRGLGTRDNGLVIEVDPGRFEDMVVAALDGLPEELGRLMRNVAVTVEHGAGPPGLLGLYEGIPLTSRTSQYAGVLPDRITIYRQAICAICSTEKKMPDQGWGQIKPSCDSRGSGWGHFKASKWPQLKPP